MIRKTETIYVPLLEEGADVWRPTQGERLPDGSYLVLSTPDYDPGDEVWAFKPGSRVVCEWRELSIGDGRERALTVVGVAKSQRQTA
jgi:hypothetical protein